MSVYSQAGIGQDLVFLGGAGGTEPQAAKSWRVQPGQAAGKPEIGPESDGAESAVATYLSQLKARTHWMEHFFAPSEERRPAPHSARCVQMRTRRNSRWWRRTERGSWTDPRARRN